MTYLVRRFAIFALTLLLISMVTFAITQVLPGDVAMMIMGTQSNPEALAGLRESLGLNDSLVTQYGRWIGGMLPACWCSHVRTGRSPTRTSTRSTKSCGQETCSLSTRPG